MAFLGSNLRIPSVRRKLFVSYHHRNDQRAYDALSEAFHDRYETIYDNSLERKLDSDNAEYILRQIRENNIAGSSCTVVLVGRETAWRKFVDWEIDATLQKEHGLIGVQLPTAAMSTNGTVIAPGRLCDNIQSGYALWVSWSQLFGQQEMLSMLIEEANAKPKRLISNQRERRVRNG